jgi:predicted secreted protein
MRHLLIIVLSMLVAAVAYAGDAAKFHALGFSQDGRYFAFEQYGRQDGSGFQYVDVFVVDLDQNSWVKGSPFHYLANSEEELQVSALAMAHEASAALLKSLKITEPAEIIAANPLTEAVTDRKTITFDSRYVYQLQNIVPYGQPAEGRYEMIVANTLLPAGENCPTEDGKVAGLVLSLRNTQTGKTSIVQQDEKVPDSRNCAMDYDIESIMLYDGPLDQRRFVAILGVYSIGFEGPDRRFIAVPIKPE